VRRRGGRIHPVVLAGAGPGDPDLLTVGALRAIREAEVLVVDRVVSEESLEERSPGARVIRVGKRPGHHAVPQSMIHELLVALARSGRRVLRLKGGDPFVLGRGGEEARALREAGVPFRILPGVSAAVAVPAYAGIPLTHRGLSHRFTVISGSRAELGKVPEEGWRALAAGEGTLVVLMGWRNLAALVERMLTHGADPLCPAAAIAQGTTAAQRVVRTKLAGLPGAVRAAGIANPMVVVVGAVVALGDTLAWFDPADARAAGIGEERADPAPATPVSARVQVHRKTAPRGGER